MNYNSEILYYERENCLNGDIILTPFNIDMKKYNKQLLDSGKIIFKYKIVEVCMDDLANYDVKKSSVSKCIINNNLINCTNYRCVLNKVYSIIGDGFNIIKNTTLNIKTINRSDAGFKYNPELGISIQGSDASKTLKEILIQCKKNNIQIQLQITLSDLNIISITNL
jgi:hypothetical protein